jgi:hypothetical protein
MTFLDLLTDSHAGIPYKTRKKVYQERNCLLEIMMLVYARSHADVDVLDTIAFNASINMPASTTKISCSPKRPH